MKNQILKKLNEKVIKQLFAGLIVIIPLFFSYVIVKFLAEKIDSILGAVFKQYGLNIPGLGIITLFLLIWLIGALTTNFLGRQFVNFYESMISRVPIVSSIFNGLKQLSDTLFSVNNKSFKQPVLVKTGNTGIYFLGFLSAPELVKLKEKNKTTTLIHVLIPNTPSPASGFVILADPKNVIPVNLSVEEALKTIISLGVIIPKGYVRGNIITKRNKKIGR